MTLFYSGAGAFNIVQNNPDISLGGWLSSSPVPNDMLNNLFGTISEKGQYNSLSETKAIFLVNDSVVKTNLILYVEQGQNDEVTFEFSPVLVPNSQNMELIASVRATPFHADFFTANGVQNSELILESFTANQVIGLWIRRTAIKRQPPPQVIDFNNSNDPFNVWYNKLQVKTENPSIIFGWD